MHGRKAKRKKREGREEGDGLRRPHASAALARLSSPSPCDPTPRLTSRLSTRFSSFPLASRTLTAEILSLIYSPAKSPPIASPPELAHGASGRPYSFDLPSHGRIPSDPFPSPYFLYLTPYPLRIQIRTSLRRTRPTPLTSSMADLSPTSHPTRLTRSKSDPIYPTSDPDSHHPAPPWPSSRYLSPFGLAPRLRSTLPLSPSLLTRPGSDPLHNNPIWGTDLFRCIYKTPINFNTHQNHF